MGNNHAGNDQGEDDAVTLLSREQQEKLVNDYAEVERLFGITLVAYREHINELPRGNAKGDRETSRYNLKCQLRDCISQVNKSLIASYNAALTKEFRGRLADLARETIAQKQILCDVMRTMMDPQLQTLSGQLKDRCTSFLRWFAKSRARMAATVAGSVSLGALHFLTPLAAILGLSSVVAALLPILLTVVGFAVIIALLWLGLCAFDKLRDWICPEYRWEQEVKQLQSQIAKLESSLSNENSINAYVKQLREVGLVLRSCVGQFQTRAEPCPVCLNEFLEADGVVHCSKYHGMHLACAREWYEHSPTCPICREEHS
jgi:hypothetical protein